MSLYLIILKNRTETEQTAWCCCGLTSPWLRTTLRCWSGDIPACNRSPESETGRTSSWISTSRPRTKDSSARREREPSAQPDSNRKNHRRRAMIVTYRHVSSLTGEIRSGLQRVLEAGHRPLAVSGAPCRGFVQRQVPDATDETTGARSLKVVTEQHRHMIHDAPNAAFVTLSCVSEPRVCDEKSGCFTVSEGGTPPTYKGPVRRVRSPPGSLFD